MGALADILLYLVVCLDPRCTHCQATDGCVRVVYEEPAGWVWSCQRCLSGYLDLYQQKVRRSKKLEVAR